MDGRIVLVIILLFLFIGKKCKDFLGKLICFIAVMGVTMMYIFDNLSGFLNQFLTFKVH